VQAVTSSYLNTSYMDKYKFYDSQPRYATKTFLQFNEIEMSVRIVI